MLRWLSAGMLVSTMIAVAFGAGGISIMIFYSLRNKKMVHCIMYCPIGTIVNVFKHINPFRMYIDKTCTL
jgi:hypothetical protein